MEGGHTIVHGAFVKHKGKQHQLYHHHARGYGIIDSIKGWVSKAYNAAHSVNEHLKKN